MKWLDLDKLCHLVIFKLFYYYFGRVVSDPYGLLLMDRCVCRETYGTSVIKVPI